MIDVAREERYRRMPVMTMMISLSEKVGLSVFGSGGFRTRYTTVRSFTLSVIDHLLDIFCALCISSDQLMGRNCVILWFTSFDSMLRTTNLIR